METMTREAWTDERLDDLTERMDRGFDRVDRDLRGLRTEMDTRFERVDRDVHDLRNEMDGRFEKFESAVDSRFDRVDDRLDSVQRSILFGAFTMTGGFLAGFGGLAALIANLQ